MPKRRAGRSDGCGVRLECRRKPCETGTSAGLPGGGDGLGFDLACTRPDTPAPQRLRRAVACVSWTGLARGLWGWEGLAGVPVAPTASRRCGAIWGHPCGLPVPRLPCRSRSPCGVAPGSPARCGATPRGLRGCRYGWIKGLPVTTRSRSAGQRRSWSGSRCRSRCRLPLPGEVSAPRDQRRGVRGDCPDAHARQRELRGRGQRGGPAPDPA